MYTPDPRSDYTLPLEMIEQVLESCRPTFPIQDAPDAA